MTFDISQLPFTIQLGGGESIILNERGTDMKELSESRIKILLEREEMLNALEGAGVDNWDGYDYALEAIRERKQREELRRELCSDLLDEIEEALCEGIDQPAGVGAGFGFLESASVAALDILLNAPITFKKEVE